MHSGQYRSLEDAVVFFNRGGATSGYVGTSENYARDLTDEERAQLAAFLRALDGNGPDPKWVTPPSLPESPAAL
jgi:hypothetical protein